MQDKTPTPYRQRQRQTTSDNPDNRDNTILLGAFIILAVLLCLAIVALLASSLPGGILPTRAPQAEFEVVPGQEAASTPTLLPPTVPQNGGRSIGDPYIPELGNTGYDVQRYTLKLDLDPGQQFIRGTTTIEAVSMLHGLAELSLDFVGYSVSAVQVNGVQAESRQEGKKLVVTLPTLLASGENFTMVIVYEGSPVVDPSLYLRFVDHLGLHYPDQISMFMINEPDGARYVFPNNDHPRDKATFRFELSVRRG